MSQNDELSRPMPISQRFSSSQLRGLITTETPSHDEANQDKTGSRQVSTEGQNLLQASDRSKIRDLLGDWEDPDLDTQYQVGVHCDISGHRSHFTLFPFLVLLGRFRDNQQYSPIPTIPVTFEHFVHFQHRLGRCQHQRRHGY
jgi:hypothetical protein